LSFRASQLEQAFIEQELHILSELQVARLTMPENAVQAIAERNAFKVSTWVFDVAQRR
jgi:hypothetical protein